jgi:hypothetical protein
VRPVEAAGDGCELRPWRATEDVPDVPGRPARTFRERAEDHKAAFGTD